MVHTVRKGHFVRVLNIPEASNPVTDPLQLRHVTLSKFGDIFISCWDHHKMTRIFKYSVNGKMLLGINFNEEMTALMVRDCFVLIGTSGGTLFIKAVHRWVTSVLLQ